VLIFISATGSAIWIAGLVALHVWATVLGLVVSMMAKTWFVDRMAWLFDDMRSIDPRYDEWVRPG
jgi:hypothetical protein